MSLQEEQVLIERCRAGDGDAWDALFSQHYLPAGRFVFQLIPDATPQDIEEVCQEAFLSAIRGIHSFSGRSRIQTWLFRIATNKARDFCARRLAAKRGGGRAPISIDAPGRGDGKPLQVRAPGSAPDQQLLSAEAIAEVQVALERLGDPCRGILELRYFADFDYESIGQTLKLNPKTVSSRLSRCLDRLGHLLMSARHAETRKQTPA
jgi:RNA polymerase sigma-70 factor (ECF subfamily)